VLYRGRELDPVSLWERFVDFPGHMPSSGFAPLVVCPNPDHPTDKRHFQINLDQPLVHCFAGCGISGTYEHAISMIEGVTDGRARRIILEHTSVTHSPASKRKRRAGSVRGSDRASDDKTVAGASLEFARSIPGAGLDYLAHRGIDADSIAQFGIGWSPEEGRIVIPVRDENGLVRLLIKRAVKEKDWPKYLYTEGVERDSLLFGAWQWDRELVRSQGIVLVEGSLDCIKLHQHGIRNVGAILGGYLSEKQAAVIARYRPRRIVTMFDKDGAGWRAVQRVERFLFKYPVFVSLYPKGKADPAELTREEAHRIIEKAMPYELFLQRISRNVRQEVASG
jgi:DNA primase